MTTTFFRDNPYFINFSSLYHYFLKKIDWLIWDIGEYEGSGDLDLAEIDEETGEYRNTIAKLLDPKEYQLNVAELLFYGV